MGQNFPVVSIAPGNGVQVANAFEPDSVAIPTMSNGDLPKYVYICAYGSDETETITVAPSIGAVNGDVTTDFPLPARSNSGVIMNVVGYTHIRYDVSPVTASVTNLSIIALEDF